MSNKHTIDSIKEYATIVIGLAMYALGWTGFLLPHQITTGGVTGIEVYGQWFDILKYK